MDIKKISFLIVMFFTCISVRSQELKGNFNVQIRETKGDLNKDGLIDKVTVHMDTIHETRPIRLQIFFSRPNGKFELIVSSTKIIEAQYPIEKNGKHNGHQISNFSIKDGNLHMESDINGKSVHKFKFRQGNFELIHFSKIVWDGNNTTTKTTFDLLTGKFMEHSQLLGSDDIFGKVEKNISVKSLPKIQNFVPFENKLY